jgi:hypothetical protein
MIDPTNINYARVAQVAQDGSPLLLQAIGRLYGVGPSERRAFGADGNGVPTWTWAVLALGAGVVIGARVQRHWPGKLPKMVSG